MVVVMGIYVLPLMIAVKYTTECMKDISQFYHNCFNEFEIYGWYPFPSLVFEIPEWTVTASWVQYMNCGWCFMGTVRFSEKSKSKYTPLKSALNTPTTARKFSNSFLWWIIFGKSWSKKLIIKPIFASVDICFNLFFSSPFFCCYANILKMF